ncbi:MAG: DUF4956 domain-containing protein [Acidimicrobiia bacterium]
MPDVFFFAIDLAAIAVLAYGIYFRRHQRRDMFLAYVALNVGVMAIAAALSEGSAGAGLGFGLFGVLSIIRLRSFELTHEEVAYFFVSLAMGLLSGLRIEPQWIGPALVGLIVATMYVADHPRLFAGMRQQTITLDGVYADERQIRERVSALLGAEVKVLVVRKIDMVNDLTTIDVRYRVPAVTDTSRVHTA